MTIKQTKREIYDMFKDALEQVKDYRYKLVCERYETGYDSIRGSIELTTIGRSGNSMRSVKLDISYDLDGNFNYWSIFHDQLIDDEGDQSNGPSGVDLSESIQYLKRELNRIVNGEIRRNR